MSEKRLFLIDGNALLYRSYYAIKRLSNSKGFPTNAIYGFILTLRKLLDREKPHYLGIVFDTGKPTLRHKMFKAYKAQRKPMPEDLVVQVPVLKKVIQAFRIPLFEFEDYEADDVLASLARLASSRGVPSVIVTTDKDLLQVVDAKTVVFNPVKEIYLDAKGVKDVFGVKPDQVVDVLSLWGDPSDNVPGVPGIGEKTSKSLIDEFGSLDNLLRNIGRVKNPRVRDKLEKNMDILETSRQLVTIEAGLKLDFKLEAFLLSEPEADELRALFKDLEFSSLLAELSPEPKKGERDCRVILQESELGELVKLIKKEKAVSLDTETTSVFPTQAELVGMSFAVRPGQAYYLPLGHDYAGAPDQIPKAKALSRLKDVLADPLIKKTGQNIKYDAIVLRREGVELEGIDHDTLVLSYLLEPNWGKHNLKKLAVVYLHEQVIDYHDVVGKGKNEVAMNAAAIDRAAPYACQDAELTLRLGLLLWPKVRERGLETLYRRIEQPLIPILADMEYLGVAVDAAALHGLSAELESELGRLEKKIFEEAGVEFNINSPQQLAHILFEKMQLPAGKKTRVTKGFSTSIDILQDLAPISPLARYALEYRQMSKLKSTYADALPQLINPATGRIHTSYNQTVTSTGRLSSSDPNLQNIPARGEMGKRFRQAFVPAKGFRFLSADYSQIELRVLAHLSGDPALVEIFSQDHDIHAETARRVFGDSLFVPAEEQRRRAKIINFSIIYGASAFSLARELQASTSEAQDFIDRYYERFPGVKEFLEAKVREAKEKGYAETLFGRQRQVPELQLADRNVQQAGRRIALNMPIQGTAADLMKMAMIEAWREMKKRGLRSRMILQVHDELVFEAPSDERRIMEDLVRECMGGVHRLHVPLKVNLTWGANWAEAK
jgi:DNA polymerase-1